MEQTLGGYWYRTDQELENYLDAYLFCVDKLLKYKHISISHMMNKWKLNSNSCYQIIAKAEKMKILSLIDRVKQSKSAKNIEKLVDEGIGYKYISVNTKNKLIKIARNRIRVLNDEKKKQIETTPKTV